MVLHGSLYGTERSRVQAVLVVDAVRINCVYFGNCRAYGVGGDDLRGYRAPAGGGSLVRDAFISTPRQVQLRNTYCPLHAR